MAARSNKENSTGGKTKSDKQDGKDNGHTSGKQNSNGGGSKS